jgi:hypothetical protein
MICTWAIRRVTIGLGLAAVICSLTAPQTLAGSDHARHGRHPHGRTIVSRLGSCTMAEPDMRATVEVIVANARDFCELVSAALAVNVFRAPLVVTPGQLWHYADATLSCILRYAHTRQRATIHNSHAACRWFRRLAPGWRLTSPRAIRTLRLGVRP